MSPIELVRWQWRDYAEFHQDRGSMVLHLVSVPLFWFGLLLLASWGGHQSKTLLVLGLLACPIALALQGIGHKREALPAKPFTSPTNAIARLVTEQLVTFPRYLLSGQALRVLSQPGSGGPRGAA